ncbi:MAG: PrsW family intramembrane metalloprotease [Candidatus Heimdallarchaeota archaeon]|nr:PrsW family intramembrane metalloprotease [Candidatus Heimdallarchaeota archaeon]
MNFLSSKLLRSISVSSFLLILTLLFISQSTFIFREEIWIFTQYIASILFLGIWVPYAFSFFVKSKIELKSLNRTFSIAIFSSLIVVIGALMLNTHLLLLILNSIFGLFSQNGNDDLLVTFLIKEISIGLLLPLNEEIIKIIPIFVISQTGVLILDAEEDNLTNSIIHKHESIISRRQFALYGITSGVIFTFLELFLYQWQSIEATIDPFSMVFEQILLRIFAPVHVLASMILALGIYSFKQQLANNNSKRIAILSSAKYILLGWGIHAFWNSLVVYYRIYLPSRTEELIFLLFIIGIFINITLIGYIWKVFHQTPEFCKVCGLEGKFHDHNDHRKVIPDVRSEISVFSKILSKISFPVRISRRKLSYSYICQYCFNRIIKGACSHCGARIYLTCPSCNTYLSETTSICPNPRCSKKIISLIENQFVSLSRTETWILGVSALASLAYILSPMSILFWMNQEMYFPITIFIFYFVIGLTIIINIFIALFINRTTGILVLYCFILNLILLIFIGAAGTTLIGFFKSLLLLDVLGAIILFFIFIIIIYVIRKFISGILCNYTPIFPEFREDERMVINNE